jgi:hypothetical protein
MVILPQVSGGLVDFPKTRGLPQVILPQVSGENKGTLKK